MRGLKRLLALVAALMIILSACFALALPLSLQPATTGRGAISAPLAHDFIGNAFSCRQPSDCAVQSAGLLVLFKAPMVTKISTALMAAMEIALFVSLCVFCNIPEKIESLCFYIASALSLRAPPTFA